MKLKVAKAKGRERRAARSKSRKSLDVMIQTLQYIQYITINWSVLKTNCQCLAQYNV